MRSTRLLSLGIGLLLAATQACSDSNPNGMVDPPVDGQGQVDAAGGTVALEGRANVVVPPGALTTEITITIETAATPANLAARGAIGQAYRYGPNGQLFGVPVTVSIFLPSDALGTTPLDQLTLLSTGGAAGNAVETLTEIQRQAAAGGVNIIGKTTHFSVIVPAVTNLPPTADAGPDLSVQVGERANVMGGGTDPEGNALGFAWTVTSRPQGSMAQLEDADTATPELVPDQEGTYVLQLTVTDDQGETATDTMEIEATLPAGPVADAGSDQAVQTGATVQLAGTATNAQGASFAWTILSGPNSPVIQNANSQNASFVASAAGTYVVQLTVTDAFGQSDTDTMNVVVTTPNRAPSGSVNAPSAVFAGTEVRAEVSASDPDGDPLTYSWTVLSPSGAAIISGETGTSVTYTASEFGTYQATVDISDGQAMASAGANTLSNAMVAGTYGVTVAADPSSCGQNPSSTMGSLPVEQANPQSVALDLEAASPEGFRGKIFGVLNGEMFSYNGPITVIFNGNPTQLSVSMNGTITQAGAMNIAFTVNAGICTIPGTIVGMK